METPKTNRRRTRNPATVGLTDTDVKTWPTIRRVILPSGAAVFQVDTRTAEGGTRQRFKDLEEARAEANKAREIRRSQGDTAFGTAELKAEGVTVAEALAFYRDHVRKIKAGVPMAQALGEYLAIKGYKAEAPADGGKRQPAKRHHLDVKSAVGHLAEAYPDKTTATFTTADIDAHLSGLECSDATRGNRRLRLNGFFNWCHKARGYAASNPVEMSAKYSAPLGAVDVLGPADAADLLHGEPRLRAWIALQMFCGLRSAEADRLDWSEIDLARGIIKLGAAKTKNKARRVVEIPANAVAWLALDGKATGPVAPAARRDLFDLLRYRLGWDIKTGRGGLGRWFAGLDPTEQKAQRKRKRRPWPQNTMRHSCLSAYYMLHGGAAAARFGGTSEKMLDAHYRELMGPDEARAWFAINPAPTAQPGSPRRRSGKPRPSAAKSAARIPRAKSPSVAQ